MSKRRKPIRLDDHERDALIDLYVERAIPIDQYDERREELDRLRSSWARLTGRRNTSNDLLHYMRNARKNGKWVRLDGNHVKREPCIELSPEETEILVLIYREHVASISLGTDAIAYDDEIADLVAKEFAADTGRAVPGSDLIGALTALRKRGLLPKVERQHHDDEDMGFDDIDLAAG